MSNLLQFEKNIEDASVAFFEANNLAASVSRQAVNLASDHLQILFEYGGAMEETRQHIAGHLEYSTHQGQLNVVVHTYRTSESTHNVRLGKVRELLLNHNNGLSVDGYNFLDLTPQTAMTTELEDENVDSTNLIFNLRFEIDLNQL